VTIHLGPPLPTASSGLPGSLERAALLRSPIWPCTGWGLPSCRCHHRHWWALTSPFHPYPPPLKLRWASPPSVLIPIRGEALPKPWRRQAVCSLWHFPWGHPRSALPTILPCGARTFLSPRQKRGKRSPGPLCMDILTQYGKMAKGKGKAGS